MSLLPSRSPQERVERFVGDCIHIMVKRRENAALEAKEQALREALQLLPDVEVEE